MKKEIPFWEKSNLTIEEAAAYFNIGINKMHKLVSDESILGHSDIATTMDIYTKATYKMVADAVILLENNSGCL